MVLSACWFTGDEHICVVVELMAMNGRQGSPLVTIITDTANA